MLSLLAAYIWQGEVSSSTSQAAIVILTVTTAEDTGDVDPGDGMCADELALCSLRAAIQESNALVGHQFVRLPVGNYVLTRCCWGDNEGAAGDLDITDDLTIVGADLAHTRITEQSPGAVVERIFDVHEGVAVQISDLAITDVDMTAILPFQESCGGGIRNFGELTASRLLLRNVRFRLNGAAVCNEGALRLTDSLIEGNHAAFFGAGGGLLNQSTGVASLQRVTMHGNRAESVGGGAIANNGELTLMDSTLSENRSLADPFRAAGGLANGFDGFSGASATVINSTISGNFTDGIQGGAGVSNQNNGSVTIINSTITGNETLPRPFRDDPPEVGGGISTEVGSTTTLVNTIVAGNVNFDCRLAADSAPPVSLGHNVAGDNSCGLSGPGDMNETDPLLGPLADNGGPTMTHALLTGSPAIDAGDDAECPDTDQRGAPRPVGAACDIGAYEAGGVVPPPPEPRGDVDCDGVVTILDALSLLGHLGELWILQCAENADADCDGAVGTPDVLVIMKYTAALPVPPCIPAAITKLTPFSQHR